MRSSLALFLIYPLWAAPVFANSIKVVALQIDPNDYMAVGRGYKARIKKLKACKVDVVEAGFTEKDTALSLDAMATRVGKWTLPDNSLFYVESHGVVIEGGKFKYPSGERKPPPGLADGFYLLGTLPDESEQYFLARDVMSKLSKAAPSATPRKFWIDACHSGACSKEAGYCVGAACADYGYSAEQNGNSQFLDSLLCSEAGDCSLWGKVDGNGDGIIEPREFMLGLVRYGGMKEEEVSIVFDSVEDLRNYKKDSFFKSLESVEELVTDQATKPLGYKVEYELQFDGGEKESGDGIFLGGSFLPRYLDGPPPFDLTAQESRMEKEFKPLMLKKGIKKIRLKSVSEKPVYELSFRMRRFPTENRTLAQVENFSITSYRCKAGGTVLPAPGKH